MRRPATYLLALTLLASVQVLGSAAAQVGETGVCPEGTEPAQACLHVSEDVQRFTNDTSTPDPDEAGLADCPGKTDGVAVQTGTGRLSACAQPVDRSSEGTTAETNPCSSKAGYRQAGASATAAGREVGACGFAEYQSGEWGPIPMPPKIQVDVGTCGQYAVDLLFVVPGFSASGCFGVR